ncbi:MAG: hypothetical protein PHY80_01515 [Rickettsiales bacterium]|nr:hypothetical protein [Rickettsiales bacterium]
MKNKIIYTLTLSLLFLYIFHLISQLKTIKRELKTKEDQINLIFKKNQNFIDDLKNRNEELKIRNEELKELQKQLENINDNCLNKPINSDIVKLLQKAGI